MTKHIKSIPVQSTQLQKALFALTTIDMITRPGNATSPTERLKRVRLIACDAIAEIEAVKEKI